MLDILKVLVVTHLICFINVIPIGGESAQCNAINLNLKLKVSELDLQNTRLQLDIQELNKYLLEEKEKCPALIDHTNAITESLKAMQHEVSPLQNYVEKNYMKNSNNNDNKHKIIEPFNKADDSTNLTTITAELSLISQGFQTFLQQFQAFNTDINAKLRNTQTNIVNTLNARPKFLHNVFEKIHNKYYYIEKSEKLNWFAAAQKCRRLGGHLVNIESEIELRYLKEHLPYESFWISLNQLAKRGDYFSIATGKRVSFTHWRPLQPFFVGDCVQISYIPLGFQFKMNSCKCHEEFYFICEANE